MQYKILYLPASTADLDAIFDYTPPHNATAAKTLLETLDSRIGDLKKFPFMGKPMPESKPNAKGYRILVIENYYVFYIVYDEEKTVKIYRILSSHQNYLKWIQ